MVQIQLFLKTPRYGDQPLKLDGYGRSWTDLVLDGTHAEIQGRLIVLQRTCGWDLEQQVGKLPNLSN